MSEAYVKPKQFEVWRPSGDRVVDLEEVNNGIIEVGSVFYNTLKSSEKNVIQQGGESSGKTVDDLFAFAYRAVTEKEVIITTTSQSYAHLRAGAMSDFSRLVAPKFEWAINRFNKTTSTYFFNNGSRLEFMTFDDEIKARGPRRHYLYVNEANSFPYETYRQLDSRTFYQTVLDYNPSSKFWAHEKLIGQPNVVRYISDHRQNKFLSEFDHQRIEAYKNTDMDLFWVYARGKTGNVKGIIYPNWVMVTPEDFDAKLEQTGAQFTGGLDFGHTNNYTAAIKMFDSGDAVWFKLIKYVKGTGNGEIFGKDNTEAEEINQWFSDEGFTSDNIVVCDSAAPGSIAALNMLRGIKYIGAAKPKGSVLEGINMLKRRKVFYTGMEIKRETEKYMWETDKQGNITNEPMLGNCDALDACRYPFYFRYYRK